MPTNKKRRVQPRNEGAVQSAKKFGEEVSVSFDGGCPGNGQSSATRMGMGVYFHSPERYKGQFNFHRYQTGVSNMSNGRAELSAAIDLCVQVLYVKQLNPDLKRANAFGDATYIVSGISSGRILHYDGTRKSSGDNADLWMELHSLTKEIEENGVALKWSWVPRHRNKEADELVNAALDNREPNEYVRSQQGVAEITLQLVRQIIAKAATFRFRSIRFLPKSLNSQFLSLVNHVSKFQTDLSISLFTILPLIVSNESNGRLRSSSDFKHLRSHLVMLQNN